MNRRNFIKLTASASMLTASAAAQANLVKNVLNNTSKLKVLFLGGTNYVGPSIVNQLINAGHEVTLFNRGQTNPTLFPSLEKLRGNRYKDKGKGLTALQGKRVWDVVIDTWQDSPLCVADTASLLRNRCKQYLYISTISVYGRDNFKKLSNITEDLLLPTIAKPRSYVDKISYGKRKLASEQAASDILGRKLTVLRPHSICGYRLDSTSDKQRYWPIRLQRGGEIFAPGDGYDTTQYIDIENLAEFTLTAIENNFSGIFNVTTTENFFSYLYGLKALSKSASHITFANHQFIEEMKLQPFSQVPMWAARQQYPGVFTICNKKALEYGLNISPLAKTFQTVIDGFYAIDTVDYEFGKNASNAGITAELEKKLLTQWKKKEAEYAS